MNVGSQGFWFRITLRAFLLLIWSFPLGALAETVCQNYKHSAPHLYKIVCKDGDSGVKAAGANSTFSESFNITSASLPTEPSSLGFETIESNIRGSSIYGPTFSLIKGFHRFGTGLSTAGQNTFFGNDIIQREYGTPNYSKLTPSETQKGFGTNLNLGTAFGVITSKTGGFELNLGMSVRYNNTTDTVGGGPGLMMSYGAFTFGAGYTRERVSNLLPIITFKNFMLGARLWILEFEYSVLKSQDGPALDPISILSMSTTFRGWTLTLATRNVTFVGAGPVTQNHMAIQYLFNQHFSAGYLVNYIPGATSLGVQLYL